jgi:hypothetical protein
MSTPQIIKSDAHRMRLLRQGRNRAKTCNQCDDPPESGTNTCAIHKFKDRERQRARRRRLRLQSS